jgi:hypothetical protein
METFNRLGIVVARPLAPGQKRSVELPLPYEVLWNISPTDPILKEMGIRYLAFDSRPPAAIESQLIPMTAEPISGVWIYKAR